MIMARSKGRKAKAAPRAVPVYAVANPWFESFHEKHRCDACGCRQGQHSQGGFCPSTLTWATAAPFPNMASCDATFYPAVLAYWTAAGTTWRPR